MNIFSKITMKHVVITVVALAVVLIFGQYAFAAQSCSAKCADRDPWDMQYCLDDCKASQQSSVIERINSTQFAKIEMPSSLEVPSTQDVCDTDAFSCFYLVNHNQPKTQMASVK